MEHVNEIIGTISDKLLAAGDTEMAVSEPVQIGKFKILIMARVSVGFGAGGGKGEGMGPHGPHGRRKDCGPMNGGGVGGGGGGGVKGRPVGVVAISEEGVQVLPVPDKPGLFDKIFEKAPELVEKIQDMMPDKQ